MKSRLTGCGFRISICAARGVDVWDHFVTSAVNPLPPFIDVFQECEILRGVQCCDWAEPCVSRCLKNATRSFGTRTKNFNTARLLWIGKYSSVRHEVFGIMGPLSFVKYGSHHNPFYALLSLNRSAVCALKAQHFARLSRGCHLTTKIFNDATDFLNLFRVGFG